MIIVAGAGPGDPNLLTVEVKEQIENASYVLAFERVAKSLEGIRDDIIKIKSVDEILPIVNKQKDIFILASGDPGLFGILEYLREKGKKVDKVLPGISSFQYMMARLMKSWDNAFFVSLHGRQGDIFEAFNHPLTVIFTDDKKQPTLISKRLYESGMEGKIYVGFNLSYIDEILVEKNIGDEIEAVSPLAVVVVENEMDKR